MGNGQSLVNVDRVKRIGDHARNVARIPLIIVRHTRHRSREAALGVAATEVPRAFRTVHPIRWTIWKGEVLPRPKKSFSPEFKDEAVKMVIETSRPIARVAKELG